MTKIELSEFVFNRMTKIYGVLRCERCGELLEVGDVVISKRKQSVIPKMYDPEAFRSSGGYSRRSFYHELCWESLFFDG